MKVCLTIAGLDPSGGAGIIADLKTFSAFGCFAAAAVTSITFQNTQGVFGAVAQTAETVRGQVLPILDDFEVAALKTGMLPTREVIEEVARIVTERRLTNFVVDPVVRSTSGFDLIDDAALSALIEKLFPLSDLITPNLPEAERIARMKIENLEDIAKAARLMQSMGAKNVIVKGGHFFNAERGMLNAEFQEAGPERELSVRERFVVENPKSDFDLRKPKTKNQKPKTKNQKPNPQPRKATDFLFVGEDVFTFEADFIETTATHGTGCTFAAAVAANLAHGKTLVEAVETAKRFVTAAIRTAPHLGRGHSPINQLVRDF